MGHNKSDLEKLYARLTIEDEEEGGMVIGAEAVQKHQETYILVGKFLTEKNINFQAMRNVMATLWRPKEGMEMHDLGGRRYSFIFYHVMDLKIVLEGGPWSFEHNTLVYDRLTGMEDPQMVPLDTVDIWVQVYDVPKGFMSETILKSIGEYIGEFIKVDPTSLDGMWKQFVRIRVKINIMKPLRRRMKIKREGGSWSWINFKYERLGNFCFVCGLLGHTERECDIVYANPEKKVECAYGVWLRAPSRNVKNNTGARWLRNMEGGNNRTEYGGGSGSQAAGNGREDNVARFTEVTGIVCEDRGDTGAVVITPINQETRYMVTDNLNSDEVEDTPNIVVEPKRKRVEIGNVNINGGPTNMQTNGLGNNMENTLIGTTSSKNVYGAGSGNQARREL